jgi:hypothetical protein
MSAERRSKVKTANLNLNLNLNLRPDRHAGSRF